MQAPDVLLLSSGSNAQSASLKPVREIGSFLGAGIISKP